MGHLDLTAIIVICYFLMMMMIGLISAKYASGLLEYHLAGRRVTYIMLTTTLCATIIGASSTVGMAGLGFKEGLTGAWWLLSGTIGLLVLSFFFSQKIRAKGFYTLPQLIGSFYGDRVRILASLLIIVSWVGVICVQIIASGNILSTLFGGNGKIFVAGSAIVFILYTVLGGQHSVVKTDMVQFVIIILGIGLLLSRTLDATGLEFLRMQSFPVSEGRDTLSVLSMIIVIGSTYLVGPDIYSRVFLAKDPRTAQVSIALSAIILIPVAFIITTLGVCAGILFPGIQNEQALPVLMMNMLTPIERGIVGSALLAAFMSSAATPLMTATTTMALDLYRKIRPSSKVPELMRTSRIGIVIIGMAALSLALVGSGIIPILFSVYTIFTSGMLVPVIAGFYKDKLRITPIGALAALCGGGLTGLVLGKSYPLLGIVVSAFLLISISRLDRRLGWSRDVDSARSLSHKSND